MQHYCAINYVCKYVNKVSDDVTYTCMQNCSQQVNKNDKAAKYDNGRYISTNDDFQLLLNFPIHESYIVLIHQRVLLGNHHSVIFAKLTSLLQAFSLKETTFTALLKLPHVDEEARKFFTHNYASIHPEKQSIAQEETNG